MRWWFTIAVVLCIHSNVVWTQHAHTHPEPWAGECATITLTDPELLREAWQNTRIASPGIEEAVHQWRLLRKGELSAGTQDLFWVYNFETRRFDTVRARLMVSGALSHLWVALSELERQHVTTTEVNVILRALEQATPSTSRDSTQGILQLDRRFFGDPPNINSSFVKGAGDGKTHVLICDIKDGWTPTSTGGFTAGFFFSVDVDPNSGFVANSNRRDLIYIDSHPGIFFNNRRNAARILGTLAHEVQHLIHWNYDPREITFFNEGLSEYAAVLCGFPLRNPDRYFNNTGVTLTSWRTGSHDVLSDYSRAALWTLYLGEQLGDTFIRRFTQHPTNGIPGFEAALVQAGITTSSFTHILQNWFLANWIRSQATDVSYGYRHPVSGRPKVREHFYDPNIAKSAALPALAVHYLRFEPAEDFRVTFTLPAGVTARALVRSSVGVSIQTVNSGAVYSPPPLGIEPIIFAVMNTNPTGSATYSYAASGKVSRYIVEHQYDDGTPDPFLQGIAPYLGFGNNSTARGFAVRFLPHVESNALRLARLMVMFNQEFSNGTAPPDADKDFMFHVWRDDNGKPGADLITPFKVTVDRNEYPIGTFVDVDLSDFREQLTNLRTPVYVGLMEDDDDSVGTYVAVDRTYRRDVSFVYRGSNHPTSPNTWATMTEVSARNNNMFDGFNLMFRAVFEYSDSGRAPTIIPGYLQNPLFTEYISVVAASPERLMPSNLSGTLTFGGASLPVGFRQVPGFLTAFVDTTSHRLVGDGQVTIRVRGTRLYGVHYTDTTVVFHARLSKREQTTIVATPSGAARLHVPAKATRDEVMLTAFDGLSNPLEAVEAGSARAVYSFGPTGRKLDAVATIRIKAPPDDSDVVLALLRDGKWLALPTSYDASAGEFVGMTDRLGIVALVPKEATAGSLDVVPHTFALLQNYPNPFSTEGGSALGGNPSTLIRYQLPGMTGTLHATSLRVYNMLGQLVATLVEGEREAGEHQVEWRPEHLPSGVYIYELRAGAWRASKRMTVLK